MPELADTVEAIRAKQHEEQRAQVDAIKNKLLIALTNRLGGSTSISQLELDNTEQYMLLMEQQPGGFKFVVKKK